MMAYLLRIFLIGFCSLLIACGGGGGETDNQASGPIGDGDNTNPPTPTNPPASGASSLYDAARIRALTQPPANLITDSGFDSTGDWQLCGASLQTEAERGQYLQLDSTPDCPQGADSFLLVNSAAYHPISLDAVPQTLHISFLARSSAPIELFEGPVDVYLVAEDSPQLVPVNFGAWVNNAAFPGIATHWTPVKMSITRDDISGWIGDDIPNWLLFRTNVSAGYQMDIDDVQLSFSETTFANIQTMPSELIGASSDRLLFMNQDEKFVGSVNPDGSGYTTYPGISSENLRMGPRWLDTNTITVGDTRFYPSSVITDATVLAAEGTDLLNYNLANASATMIYQSIGSPGRFEFSGSFGNIDALDVTIRNGEWDSNGARGAFAMCGQNRQWDFVSDDICVIAIMDSSGTILNDDTNGYNPAWSADGRIAFVYENNAFIGTVDASGQISAQAVVTSGGTPRTVAWSPDSSQLAVMADGVANVVVAGESYTAQSVSLLDVASGDIEMLTLLDHGNAYSDLTWIDGSNYLAYSVLLDNPVAIEIWWLDVRTGQTGPIVNTINAGGVHSR
jgi:hypothetical protein